MEEMENTQNVSQVVILLAFTLAETGRRVALAEEDLNEFDQSTGCFDGVIIRDESKDLDLLIARSDIMTLFGDGPADMDENDRMRKYATCQTMTLLDGEARSRFLLCNHLGEYQDGCALCVCRDYGEGFWLPSGGEMAVIHANIEEVNNIMDLFGGDAVPYAEHWTSSLFNDERAWHADMGTGTFGFWRSKTTRMHVRPVASGSGYETL